MKFMSVVRTFKGTFCVGALSWLFAAPAMSQGSDGWVQIKDPKELQALFTNTTFKGKTNTGDQFTAYNHADGKQQMVVPQADFMRHWKINGGEACTQVQDRSLPEICSTFSKHATRKGEYQARRVKDGAVSSFSLTPGTKGARKY
jgi:hypothetical protein